MLVDRCHECWSVFVEEGHFHGVVLMWAAEAGIHVGYGLTSTVYTFLGEAGSIVESTCEESGPMGVKEGRGIRVTHETPQCAHVPCAVGGHIDSVEQAQPHVSGETSEVFI